MGNIAEVVSRQREYFKLREARFVEGSGAGVYGKSGMFGKSSRWRVVKERKRMLGRLYDAIVRNEQALLEALQLDLGKSATEAYMCEIGLTLSEISYIRRHLWQWSRDRIYLTPLTNFPALSKTVQEPYGVVLIMSPWNYPVLLSLEPLVGAIAAGNCVVLKPSAYSPNTSEVLERIIGEVFKEEEVAVVRGGRAENQDLLEQRFDYIFFTGSVAVGKYVMEKASRYLTPVTLELGGKSPCVIDHTADLRVAARRLAFGKWVNCGQTCIAPDYVLIERSVHDAFMPLLKEEIQRMFYVEGTLSSDYGKIINKKHFERLQSLIIPEKVVCGGGLLPESLQIEPTVMDGVEATDAVMQEEIFGPILPILVVDDMEAAKAFILDREKPLALYLFSEDRSVRQMFVHGVPFGGGCVNDTIMHIATSYMPFGGVGNSGMGSYHGKRTFETFSHTKSVVVKPNGWDMPLRYAPYGKWKLGVVRRVLR